MRRGFLGHVTREDWGHTLGTPGRRMDNLDALGYLKKGSIAHTGYFAILWYCTYCSMCNTHTSAVLHILDTVLRIPDPRATVTPHTDTPLMFG